MSIGLFVLLFLFNCAHSVTWSVGSPNIPTDMSGMAYGSNDSLVFLIGGLTSTKDEWSHDIYTFSIESSTFTKLSRAKAPEFFFTEAQASAQKIQHSPNEFNIYIMGPIQQKSTDTNGWIYNTITGLFDQTSLSHFPNDAQWPCTVINNDILYLIGGITDDNADDYSYSYNYNYHKYQHKGSRVDYNYNYKNLGTRVLADVIAYNLTSGQWITDDRISSMNTKRYEGSCLAYNDYLYVFGGTDGENILDSIEKYSIQDNSWQTVDSTLSTPRTGHRNVIVKDGNGNDVVLLIGGIGVSNTDFLQSVEYYDLSQDTVVSDMQSNLNFARNAPGVAVVNNGTEILVFGGQFNDSMSLNSYEIGSI